MSEVLYEASPSLVRMNPFGTFLVILLLIAGIALSLPPLAGVIGAMVGLPPENANVISVLGLVIAAVAFLVLLVWYVKTKLDKLLIKKEEVVWTHGLLSKQYTEINMTSIRTVRVQQSPSNQTDPRVRLQISDHLPERIVQDDRIGVQ